jgi:hypothetical protein
MLRERVRSRRRRFCDVLILKVIPFRVFARKRVGTPNQQDQVRSKSDGQTQLEQAASSMVSMKLPTQEVSRGRPTGSLRTQLLSGIFVVVVVVLTVIAVKRSPYSMVKTTAWPCRGLILQCETFVISHAAENIFGIRETASPQSLMGRRSLFIFVGSMFV